jgi:hypothetical protein
MYALQHVIEEASSVEFYMSTLIYVPAAPVQSMCSSVCAWHGLASSNGRQAHHQLHPHV